MLRVCVCSAHCPRAYRCPRCSSVSFLISLLPSLRCSHPHIAVVIFAVHVVVDAPARLVKLLGLRNQLVYFTQLAQLVVAAAGLTACRSISISISFSDSESYLLYRPPGSERRRTHGRTEID